MHPRAYSFNKAHFYKRYRQHNRAAPLEMQQTTSKQTDTKAHTNLPAAPSSSSSRSLISLFSREILDTSLGKNKTDRQTVNTSVCFLSNALDVDSRSLSDLPHWTWRHNSSLYKNPSLHNKTLQAGIKEAFGKTRTLLGTWFECRFLSWLWRFFILLCPYRLMVSLSAWTLARSCCRSLDSVDSWETRCSKWVMWACCSRERL